MLFMTVEVVIPEMNAFFSFIYKYVNEFRWISDLISAVPIHERDRMTLPFIFSGQLFQ